MIGASLNARENASVSMVAEVMMSLSSGRLVEQALEVAEQEIDVEAALVGFVDDEGVVFGEQRVALGLGQQDAVGHELDVGVRAGAVVEADFAADFAAPVDVEFLGDAPGDGERGDAAGLGAADFGLDAQPGFEAHFGDLGGFAGAGFAGDDDDLVMADGGDDVVFAGGDGQFGRIADLGDALAAACAEVGGSAGLGEQAIEDGVVFGGVMVVAQEADEARAEPHPIVQEAAGQQRLQFVNAGISHSRGR